MNNGTLSTLPTENDGATVEKCMLGKKGKILFIKQKNYEDDEMIKSCLRMMTVIPKKKGEKRKVPAVWSTLTSTQDLEFSQSHAQEVHQYLTLDQ